MLAIQTKMMAKGQMPCHKLVHLVRVDLLIIKEVKKNSAFMVCWKREAGKSNWFLDSRKTKQTEV
jgi:hypothetical protein